jgi:ABC-type oligopeptide transport system ATPase subunit
MRAQVINLIMVLQQQLGLSYFFISHDMAVVERISHRVAVMYLGQIVELGPRRAKPSSATPNTHTPKNCSPPSPSPIPTNANNAPSSLEKSQALYGRQVISQHW